MGLLVHCVRLVVAAVYIAHHRADADSASAARYGCVVDVGSSGSRIRVYQWTSSPDSIPADIDEVFSYKVYPGFSTLADDPGAIREYVLPLLDQAVTTVPEESHASTPLYFLATAGMRMLPSESANALMDAANEVFLDTSLNPFLYDAVNARILSGEEEGAFAWIAANYLRGYFTGGSVDHAGILEMGGASAQIAFIPDGSVLDGLFPVTLAGTAYNLYSQSYLDYGQEQSEFWVEEYMWKQNAKRSHMYNPCMLRGDEQTTEIRGQSVTMTGSGNPDDCLEAINNLVYTVGPAFCHPSPCAIGPFYQPAIPDDMVFYGLSSFLYIAEDLDQMYDAQVLSDDGTMDPQAVLEGARRFCQEDYDAALTMSIQDPEFAAGLCFQGLYFSTLILKGYGFDNASASIETVSKINGQSVEWTMGAVIYECMA